ncbi:mitochondrial endonuclease LCL3 (SNase domain-containing protein) [Andalucia godoyi]|uniref:Mitochondrial endonuclease LCL3 (SNase domain-containing protein) n=1 Tax=Andalucia godoyi TaxID=505711 RepID=A0A8K0F425_ANDGO|nr:mitochondrial endonuclease LCL3 (SNase domain-containing protein) [Andalucia godoyi]|eukprot:ANDGO_07879.mRNA.1 mitochondrial endonuclease LCL3 (SNase domain-containing protein)
MRTSSNNIRTNNLLSSATGGPEDMLARFKRLFGYVRVGDDLTRHDFDMGRVLSGRVFKVVDSDNFRVSLSRFSAETLHVRVCGVDAPEAPHFGNPGQPFAEEAKQFLTALVDGKHVRVRVLSRDQYGRIVGDVFVGRRNVSLEMARNGWAVVYEGKGALYGDCGKEVFDRYVAIAKSKKLGMWVQKNFESPREYKKKIREGAS